MCKYFLEPKGIWDLVSISPTPPPPTHNFVFIFCFASLVLILIQYFLTRLPNFFSDIVETSENKSFQARRGWSTTAAGGVRMSSQGARWPAERNQQESQGARWPRGTNKKNLCRHQNGSRQNTELYIVVHVWETETRFCENVTVLKINILELCVTSIRRKVEEIET